MSSRMETRIRKIRYLGTDLPVRERITEYKKKIKTE